MSKLLQKATSQIGIIPPGKFEKFNLTENPFPSQAILNKDSTEKKFNGSIYEPEIRTIEYEKLLKNFIQVPQSDLTHQRLGFILDSSYIGRGNGKTAFLLNILKKINEDFSLNLSNGVNKCFGVYFQPESGGKTKSFDNFIDIFFQALIDSNIINYALAVLRLEAIIAIKGNEDVVGIIGKDENEIVKNLNYNKWFEDEMPELLGLSKREISIEIFKNQFLQSVSEGFPLKKDVRLFLSSIVTQDDFKDYYKNLKKGGEKLYFIFSEIVYLFLAAGFNGSYVFIDDFERIPDHQSAIQKKDFVTQLRTILYDGVYLNSKIGFYNFIFALHAGVPRILQEAWGLSGLEHRVSLNPAFDNPRHMIMFNKISEGHAVLLIEKYLSEFRITTTDPSNSLFPFDEDAIKLVALKSELNAAKILQLAFNIIELALEQGVDRITREFVQEITKESFANVEVDSTDDIISKTETIDLLKKAQKED